MSTDNRMGLDTIHAYAAEWIVKQAAGLSDEDARQLDAWLAEDPRHAAAFAEQAQTWSALNRPRETGLSATLARTLDTYEHRRRARRFRAGLACAGLAAAVALLFAPDEKGTGIGAAPAVATVLVKPDRQVLPDGSVVELNAGAEIRVDFGNGFRRVRLVHGEALFQVTKNPAMPFIVSAGLVDVTAVGTAFSVRHGAEAIGVLVTEGSVTVAHPTEPSTKVLPAPLLLEKGDRVQVPAESGSPAPIEREKMDPVRIGAALAWRGKRVEFSDTPVAEAVALFNRQNRIQLAAGDAAVSRLQLSGIFWADDPEGFVRLLESGMNVRAARNGNVVMLHSRP